MHQELLVLTGHRRSPTVEVIKESFNLESGDDPVTNSLQRKL